MSRATEDLMDSLHGMTAAAFLAEIERMKAAGEGIPPALLTAAGKFLKDNGVDRAARAGDTLDKLADVLPDLDSVVQFPGRK